MEPLYFNPDPRRSRMDLMIAGLCILIGFAILALHVNFALRLSVYLVLLLTGGTLLTIARLRRFPPEIQAMIARERVSYIFVVIAFLIAKSLRRLFK